MHLCMKILKEKTKRCEISDYDELIKIYNV